jgi:hypothetical protein
MTLKSLDGQISESSIITASGEQISSSLGEETVILNLKNGVYHGLNEMGTRIWDLIQQPKVVKEIKQTLLEEYEVESEVCMRDLLTLLENLKVSELIEVKNETSA